MDSDYISNKFIKDKSIIHREEIETLSKQLNPIDYPYHDKKS